MLTIFKKSILCLLALAPAIPLQAHLPVGSSHKAAQRQMRTSSSCLPSSSTAELNVNNVRALLLNGGDSWWDLQNNPRYEIPKVDDPAKRRYSSFAGGLWIGGVDDAGQLRVAAQTYRQSGNDFWPGPLSADGSTTEAVCNQWDRHFTLTRNEVRAFRAAYNAWKSGGPEPNLSQFPNVKNWPAFGITSSGEQLAMAPVVDGNGNEFDYNLLEGDYPDIRPVQGGGEPDQVIWWVINDKGDIHTSTGGQPIGIEIQMMAFAFATSTAINDMTFYKYKVIHKGEADIHDTYMGQWADSDIGFYKDDYVGCDVGRGLGFAFNGDPDDDGATGYGMNPPAFGMDFFQGPKDEFGNRLSMKHFVYYENQTTSLIGDPTEATHFYGYLRGYWKDGSRMVDNGENGWSATGAGPDTDYMFPGNGGWCQGEAPSGWWEGSAGSGAGREPGDRRFLQSAGPFTLQSGAVNEIITGAVWARGNYNDNKGSVCELLSADDIAQALFDANFQLLDGPDAPFVDIGEYDQELLIQWDYPERERGISNNVGGSYIQSDPVLVATGAVDPYFQFQGYMVYQLKDGSVSANELMDSERARLVAQCDLRDGVSTIVNQYYTTVPGLPAPILTEKVMVQGEDEGVFHAVRVGEDLFADGADRRLRNYTTYYYAVIAYAHNDVSSDGRQFVQGNGNYAQIKAMPHRITFEQGGTEVNAGYDEGMQITRTEGSGNAGRNVAFSSGTEQQILLMGASATPTYQTERAPIAVRVTNPKEIVGADYRLELTGGRWTGEVTSTTLPDSSVAVDSLFSEWDLYEDGRLLFSSLFTRHAHAGEVTDRPMPLSGNERLVPDRGFAILTDDAAFSSGDPDPQNKPVISSTVIYTDPAGAWLTGLADYDDKDFKTWDWVESGSESTDRKYAAEKVNDPNQHYEKVLGGRWAPFCMARTYSNDDAEEKISPGVGIGFTANATRLAAADFVNLDELPDVDIVFTPDPAQWSRCVVVETTPAQRNGSGAWPMTARWAQGIDQNGRPMPGALTPATQGWSWFPGYALNVSTGERLNVFFGENSSDLLNHGDDLLFNPTADLGNSGTKAGGRHYIYVSLTRYDGCQAIHDSLAKGTDKPIGGNNSLLFSNGSIGSVYKDVAWVGIPMNSGVNAWDDPHKMPSGARLSLRVNQPLQGRQVFTWDTRGLAAQFGQQDIAKKSFMEDVRIVPNPYYAYSRYERSQLQNMVKLTNLPQRCKVRIYTLSGTLIRTFNKDSEEPEQLWDLKNEHGVPIASGPYIIHVDGYELGETVVKFMAVMPTADLTSY